MTGARLAHEDLIAALSDLRLPPLSTAQMAGDLCATVALALAAALVLGTALRPLLARRPPARLDAPQAPPDEPPEIRRLRLVRLLKGVAPEEAAAFAEALYRPGAPLDEDELRRRLSHHGLSAG